MELTVLGSSSSGNCYILQNEHEALVLECGVPFREVKRAVDFNISKIKGALITHEHGDHSKHTMEFLHNHVPVWASAGTTKCLKSEKYTPFVCTAQELFRVGRFMVMPFLVRHDSAEPYGYLINHEETGIVLFATDTYFLPNTFVNLSNVLIECNYRSDILEANIKAGKIPAIVRDRTLQSHMSLDTCITALKANDLSKVNNIVLLHLSDGNSNAKEFQAAVRQATHKTVHVADKGLHIKFNRTPF